MRVLIQRVKKASVTIEGNVKSSIGNGLLIFVGICDEDNYEDIECLVKKIANIRLFDDENGVMNRSVTDVKGELLAVSQFTLRASTKKGNRPSYIRSAKEAVSKPMYENFLKTLSEVLGEEVEHGEFGADMQVSLVNDGPVTICIDSKNRE